MPMMSVKAKARIAAMLIAVMFTVNPSPSSTMLVAGIRRKAVPYGTTEIAGEMELFPAH